jgi:hypothetical protein
MSFPTIDPTSPAGTDKGKVLDDQIRGLKTDIINSFKEISGFPNNVALRGAKWTTLTRPTENLVDRLEGFNTTLGVDEYYDLATTSWLPKSVSAGHVAATGAHTAAKIANVAAGNIVATDVQAAINELDTEKAKLAGDIAQVFSAADATLDGHVLNLGQFLSSMTDSGYFEFPVLYNGSKVTAIVQWATGTTVAGVEGTQSISFAKAFPNACLKVLVSTFNTTDSATNDGRFELVSKSATACVVRAQYTATTGGSIAPDVIAIGY